MRITGEWLSNDATQAVFKMLIDAGFLAYGVGGCVRNAVLGQVVNDVDMATDAHPKQVIALAKSAGLHAIPTGIDHGTVTVVSGKIPHEITTFRRDVETDGRRAVVAFSTDVIDDARRRDFTMNALYCDSRGEIFDPLDGLNDLIARKLRFIDDPVARIREDYLRILRFFRFYAWYGDPSVGFDPDGLAACAEHHAGLETVSRERIGAEVLKTLGAPDPAPAIAAMMQTGVLGAILVGADARMLPIVLHGELSIGATPNAICRLASLGGEGVPTALRLSRSETRMYDLLRAEMGTMTGPHEIAYRHGAAVAEWVVVLRAAVFEHPVSPDAVKQITKGARATLPISAADLMPSLTGRALGDALRAGETAWIKSDFSMKKQDILRYLGVE